MPRILTAGHVNWDVTLRVDRLPEPDGESQITARYQSGGGSAANVAVALASLDVSVGLIGSIGSDDTGVLTRRELDRHGIDLAGLHVVDGETTVKYVLVDQHGDVSMLGNDGVNEAIEPDMIDPDLVRIVDHVHLTSQRPETAAKIARVAGETGATVSVDPGRRIDRRDFTGVITRADVLFVNDREAETVIDETDLIDDARSGHRIVVVTDGAAGAVVHTTDRSYHHPGFTVQTMDAAGAGDAFAAGFLVSLFDNSDEIHDADFDQALEFANACGAIAASTVGARQTLDYQSIDAFLGSHR